MPKKSTADMIIIELRKVRMERDLSQTYVAERLGVTQVYLYLIETGDKEPRLALVRKYCEELGLELETFMCQVFRDSYIASNM